jgi:hypothetical protein
VHEYMKVAGSTGAEPQIHSPRYRKALQIGHTSLALIVQFGDTWDVCTTGVWEDCHDIGVDLADEAAFYSSIARHVIRSVPMLVYPESKRMSWRPERRAPVAGAATLRTRHYIRLARSCSGAEWSHPLFFSNRNIRWLDFARHDSMRYWNTPVGGIALASGDRRHQFEDGIPTDFRRTNRALKSSE